MRATQYAPFLLSVEFNHSFCGRQNVHESPTMHLFLLSAELNLVVVVDRRWMCWIGLDFLFNLLPSRPIRSHAQRWAHFSLERDAPCVFPIWCNMSGMHNIILCGQLSDENMDRFCQHALQPPATLGRLAFFIVEVLVNMNECLLDMFR
jgi:hypothetical protein